MKRNILQTETEYLLSMCNTLLNTNITTKKHILKIRHLVMYHRKTEGVLSHCLIELDKIVVKNSSIYC